MWPGGVVLAAVVLSVAAFVFAPGAPFVAVPVALIVLGVGWLLRTTRDRRKVGGVRNLREQAETAGSDSDEIEFTDRDKQSLYTR
jgi:hypothetical protein